MGSAPGGRFERSTRLLNTFWYDTIAGCPLLLNHTWQRIHFYCIIFKWMEPKLPGTSYFLDFSFDANFQLVYFSRCELSGLMCSGNCVSLPLLTFPFLLVTPSSSRYSRSWTTFGTFTVTFALSPPLAAARMRWMESSNTESFTWIKSLISPNDSPPYLES